MDSLYQKLKFLVLILSITTVGSACSVGPNIVQIDKPIELVSGAPKNECEQKFFLQAVPSKIVTKARQSSSKTAGNELVTIVKTLETTSQGLALYQYGQAKALKLPEVLPKLENEALTNTHMKRIQPYLDRRNQINKVALRSLAIQSIGIAMWGPAALGKLSIGVGILGGVVNVGGVGMLLTLDFGTLHEMNYLTIREHLLLEEEDDLKTATQSVDSYNTKMRQSCAGE